MKLKHLAAAASLFAAVAPVRSAHAQRVLGLDVSNWQSDITQSEWTSIRNVDNRQFAFIRSSRGGTTGEDHRAGGYPAGDNFFNLSQRYDDPRFLQNVTRATNAGIFTGSYHFGRPDIIATTANSNGIPNNATDEADHMVQMAGALMRPGYLQPVYDFEAGSGIRTSTELAQYIVDFSNRVYTLTNIRPAIYLNGSYAQSLQSVSAALRNQIAQPTGLQPSVITPGYPTLWAARWPTSPDIQNDDPKDTFAGFYGPFDDYGDVEPWDFWQYTSQGTVTGISPVDLNVSHGDIEYLKDSLVPAVWMNDASGDWSTMLNWNSGQPVVAPVTPAGQLTPFAGTLPTPRLPGASGSGPTAGSNDTVILERPSANITVTHSAGTTTNVRKLYVREALNITGGSLTANYDPTYAVPLDGSGNPLYPNARRSGPISAQFSAPVTLSGGSLNAHTIQVDALQTFTVTGGTLAFQAINLMPGSTSGKLLLGTDLVVTPAGSNTVQIDNGAGSGSAGQLDLSAGNRTFAVANGSANVDFSVSAVVTNGSIIKTGPGTMRLAAANTYSGGTTVDNSHLLVSNTTGSGTGTGAVTMNAGTTLGGTGRITGPVTLNAATLAPGESIGTLNTNAVTFTAGSNYNYEYNSLTRAADLLNTNGSLSLPAGVNLGLANLGVGQINKDTKLTLMSYAGAWNGGTFSGYANNSVFSFSGNDWRIRYDDTPAGAHNGGAYPNALTLLALTGPESTQIDGFLAQYAPINWLTGGNLHGATVNVSGAPASITITGPNDGSGTFGDISYTIAAKGDGTFSFDWAYSTTDSPGWDFAYYINGTETLLSSQNGQSGHVEVPVDQGDIIGWRITSTDSIGGAGVLTLSNFSAPAPEPTTGAILVLLATAHTTRRRRRRTDHSK